MMDDLGYILIILAFLGRHWLAERAWAGERRRLCDRLQAGTLQDYVHYEAVKDEMEHREEPEEEKPEEEPIVVEEPEVGLRSEIERRSQHIMGE